MDSEFVAPSFLEYRERYLENLTPDLVRKKSLRYGLSVEQIGDSWMLSEAGVFSRYLYDFDLSVSDFDGKDCVDIGCGFGLFRKAIMRCASPRRFVNLDYCLNPFGQSGVVDVAADASVMPFLKESFDIVLVYGSILGISREGEGFDVMEPGPINEIVRILRPGGAAKIGPLSLLRSCWRSQADIDFYLQNCRVRILDYIVSFKEQFPEARFKFYRNIDAENHDLFDEWLEICK